jgi:citrate lyase subunit beta/citryl-CoA lyase
VTEWLHGPAWLFCPADRPDRYPKALGAADVVILDLEDAVAPGRKDAAREAVRRLADDGALAVDRTVIRLNGADTADHAPDLALVAEAGVRRVMLAKSENPDHLAPIEHEVVLLVETPRGIENVGALAAQSNVVAVMWGADDLVAGLGGTSSRRDDGRYRDVARYARSRALLAAKSWGRLALDAVHLDIADQAGLAAECEDAAAVGFDATVAIHPSQLSVIRQAYGPSPERVDWARRLLAGVSDDTGVTTFEGRMVDGPVFAQARRLLRLAESVRGGV